MDIQTITQLAVTYALPAVLAFFVFVIGSWLARKISRAAEKNLNKSPNGDPTLSRFFANLIKYILLFVVIMAALTVLGVDTSSGTAAILGLGAAMAFVLQGALGNLAAGVMLLIFRPYNVGDEVEIDGVKGVVTEIGMTATRLKTRDNVELIVANGKAWNGVVRNHNALGARRLDMVFGVSYDADINTAIQALTAAAANDPRVHAEPEPWAKVVALNESSVDIELRAWCDYNDLRALKVSISQPVKQALDAAGIGIPYPHEVKIKKSVKSPGAKGGKAKAPNKNPNTIKSPKLDTAKLKNT